MNADNNIVTVTATAALVDEPNWPSEDDCNAFSSFQASMDSFVRGGGTSSLDDDADDDEEHTGKSTISKQLRDTWKPSSAVMPIAYIKCITSGGPLVNSCLNDRVTLVSEEEGVIAVVVVGEDRSIAISVSSVLLSDIMGAVTLTSEYPVISSSGDKDSVIADKAVGDMLFAAADNVPT